MAQSTIPAPAGCYEEFATAVGVCVPEARAATVTQALALKLRREQLSLTEAVRALSGERAPESALRRSVNRMVGHGPWIRESSKKKVEG